MNAVAAHRRQRPTEYVARADSLRLAWRLLPRLAVVLLAGVALHLYCEGVALGENGASWAEIGGAWARSAAVAAAWCAVALVAMGGGVVVAVRAVTAAPRAAATGSGAGRAGGVRDERPTSEAVAPVRRILTLATTRVGIERDDWAWLEVEREAMRVLAALGEPGEPGPAGDEPSPRRADRAR
jgi:hypothetical protein